MFVLGLVDISVIFLHLMFWLAWHIAIVLANRCSQSREAVDMAEVAALIPPLNFAMVAPGVYRSGYPNKKNLAFLAKLGIKTIVCLYTEKEYPDEHKTFMEVHGMKYHMFCMEENKEPFSGIDETNFRNALNKVQYGEKPLLIHCSKGTHRTGCLVGCLRKIHNWSMTSIFDEYRRFAKHEVRLLDEQYIELFDPSGPHAMTESPLLV